MLNDLSRLGWGIRVDYGTFEDPLDSLGVELISVYKGREKVFSFVGRVDKDRAQLWKAHRKVGNTYEDSRGREEIRDSQYFKQGIPDQRFSGPRFVGRYRLGRYPFIMYDTGDWLDGLKQDVKDLKNLSALS